MSDDLPKNVQKKSNLKVVIYWHMHQPEYRDLRTGEYQLPWTYLHAIKDYIDMAAHLEAVPQARAVVNFAPILLEQIADYAEQVRGFQQNNMAIRDPLLAALAGPTLPAAPEQQLGLIKDCLRANEERLIKRFSPYARLAGMAHWLIEHPDAVMYAADQYLVDLLVWYHLAWMAETVRRNDQRVKDLIDKQTGYTVHDRRVLLEIIGELLSSVIDRYKALAETGQVELSMTPYAHPIMPLLLDINSTHEAMPDAPLPVLEHYPEGERRTRWHLQKGMDTFKHFFGFSPQGCWPSEGSISERTLRLLQDSGFRWTASGGNVLHNSLQKSELLSDNDDNICNHHSYRLKNSSIASFFRDDGLSDLIGFTYSDWHADDAVANLTHHLENIAKTCESNSDSIVSIILDGENAWEHYPDNGYYFLHAMYKALVKHPAIELTTYSDYLGQGSQLVELPHVVAGSWVYGTFSTWIGDPDKNRGWDMLGDAKHAFDAAVSSGRLNETQRAAAEKQLAVCEGSDWFWWFGDYNPAQSVSDFERLYRLHLSNLYQCLGEEPPAYLSHSFTHGGGTPAMGGAMRPGQEHV